MIRAAVLGWVGALTMQFALAQTDATSEDPQERMEQTLAEFRQRLEQTDDRAEKKEPTMEDQARSRQAVLGRYGIDLEGGSKPRLGFPQARSLRSDLGRINDDMLRRLKGIPFADQLDELKKIQEAQGTEIRERIRVGIR